MIEITHRQARRLIREGMDRELADEQWAVLQAHLEGCAECRAYVQHAQSTERGLVRAFRGRWASRDLRGEHAAGMGGKILTARKTRAELLRWGLRALLGLAAVLALLIISSIRAMSIRARQPTLTPAVRVQRDPHVTPSPSALTFRGRLVYSALDLEAETPNSDIFLLNRAGVGQGSGQSEITNLTNHPAEDVYPVWSPDGEWIAFFSNRPAVPGGVPKFNLYVIQVAGTRLTRLTGGLDIEWSGPVSWSSNGRYIALTGASYSRGTAGDQRFVYLVPVSPEEDGGDSGPRALAFSGHALGPLRFSPTAGLLAFAETTPGSLLVFDQISGAFTGVKHDNLLTGGMLAEAGQVPVPWTADGDFDWSPDGRQIAYLTYGLSDALGAQQELWLSPDLFSNSTGIARAGGTQPLLTRLPGSMRSVTWLPARSRRVLAYLQREVGGMFTGSSTQVGDCWTVRLQVVGTGGQSREIKDLCVESPLGPTSWSDEGAWLVVSGRLPRQPREETALYALKIPADLALREEIIVERLADLPLEPDRGDALRGRVSRDTAEAQSTPQVEEPPSLAVPADIYLPAPAPQVRSLVEQGSGVLRIRPLEYAVKTPLPPPRLPMPGSEGELFYTITGADSGVTLLAQRAVEEPRVLIDDVPGLTCPTASPDGKHVAYIAPAEGQPQIYHELFVFDRQTFARSQITSRYNGQAAVEESWSCPVWSPDGQWLSFTTRSGRNTYLVTASPQEGRVVRQITLDRSYTYSEPVWLPDGSALVVVVTAQGRTPLRILQVDPFTGDTTGAPGASPRVVYETRSFDDILGMAFSPDSRENWPLAFVAADYLSGGGARLRLFRVNLDGSDLTMLSDLPDMAFQGGLGRPGLAWLPGRGLVVPVRQRPDALTKTQLWLYDINNGNRVPLVMLDELVINTAWSPSRRWMAYTSDSGLYLVNLRPGEEGRSAPEQISGDSVYDLDWK